MKMTFVMICLLLVVASLRANEAEDLVYAYIQNRRDFPVERITPTNRASVISLLKEIQVWKRDTILGGIIVQPSQAEKMLIRIGDEETIRALVLRYLTRDAGPTNISALVEDGQALAIPFLAEDLVSYKYLYFYQVGTDGRPERVLDLGRRYDTATNIVLLVVASRQLPADVRESAITLQAALRADHDAFVRRVTAWWYKNRRRLEARQFSEVQPFGEAR